MRKWLQGISIAMIISGLALAGFYFSDLNRNKNSTDALRAIVRTTPETTSPSPPTSSAPHIPELTPVPAATAPTFRFDPNPMRELFAINSDLVGWIRIEDTRIDYPVVKGRDNEFYLDYDFYKNKNISGSIFMDYRNIGNGDNANTIIYGHGIRDQSMFHDLVRFLDPAFYESHRIITLQTLYGDIDYKVFASYRTNTDFYYIRTRFDADTFGDFMEGVKDRTVHDWDVEVTDKNKILTLSTCSPDLSDGRLVVHAIRID